MKRGVKLKNDHIIVDVVINMTSKLISITTEAYEMLDKYRLKEESFSMAILRLLKSKTNIMELAGAWKKIPDVEPAINVIEEIVKKVHEDDYTSDPLWNAIHNPVLLGKKLTKKELDDMEDEQWSS